MSIFNTILSKLGITHPAAGPAPAPKPSPASPTSVKPGPQSKGLSRDIPASAPASPAKTSVVDVVSKLEAMAAANPQKLNWKVSIVDLLKLLGIDSGFESRKELAVELGCPADKMGDSAQMNTWLHKTVLQKIADNGGNIPKELLD
jgi:hypothetical protein